MRTLLLLAVAAQLAAAAPVPKDFQRPVNYHPLAVGDKREFVSPTNPDAVTQVREITAVEVKDGVKHYTQVLTGGQTSVLKAEKGVVHMAEQNGQKMDPPYKVVAPDMKEGDTWACKDPTGMTRTVGKAEKITVPAGTFTALPHTQSYTNFQPPQAWTAWHAPGVGRVKFVNYEGQGYVLLKFTAGKEKK